MDAFLGIASRPKTDSQEKKTVIKSDFRPWVEKYRPRRVEDITLQNETVAVLKHCVSNPGNFPNLLFYGPPGTGKTSSALAIGRQLFGELYSERVLELNASDERGIQVIRDKVKTFSQFAASGFKSDGTPCPAFKLIILDEADSMTNAAQSALRRTMEKQARTTRFCLICNYISRIIDPITSRCMKFRFQSLTGTKMQAYLKEIAEKESVRCEEDSLERLVAISDGDMRKAITFLQSASRYIDSETLTVIELNELGGVVPDDVISRCLEVALSNSFKDAILCVKDIVLSAYSAGQVLNQLFDLIIDDLSISDPHKALIIEHLAVIDKRLVSGADEYIQMLDAISFIQDTLHK